MRIVFVVERVRVNCDSWFVDCFIGWPLSVLFSVLLTLTVNIKAFCDWCIDWLGGS